MSLQVEVLRTLLTIGRSTSPPTGAFPLAFALAPLLEAA